MYIITYIAISCKRLHIKYDLNRSISYRLFHFMKQITKKYCGFILKETFVL